MKNIGISRFFQFGIGILATQSAGYAFDYIIYPIVTYYYGPWKSVIILFLLALVLNYALVLVYDVFKIDLFSFEEIKKFKDDTIVKTWKEKLLQKIIQMGEIPAFIALSFYDPFLAVLYKRESRNFDGFKKKDYWNLVLATFIGCFLWSLLWTPIIFLK